MNILVAGHPDDEIIGAFGLIKKGLIDLVVYVGASVERLKYARTAGKELGFKVESIDFRDLHAFFEVKLHIENCICLVPDMADNHPLHKAINLTGRMSVTRLGYYTTDMNTGYVKELSVVEKKEKLCALNKYYPDQKSLWENDWKYFLFEGTVLDFM